jgi:hypothetical protein
MMQEHHLSEADHDVAKGLHLEEVMVGRKRYKVAAHTNSMEKQSFDVVPKSF